MRRPHLLRGAVALAFLVAAALVIFAARAGEPAPAEDVLIIHAAGTPFEGLAALTAANVDAVSCPTPVAMNCGTVAEQVAAALRAKGLKVRVADAAAIKHRDEVLRPRLVVLGTPCYFATASWKMVRLLDEAYWQIWALKGDRLGGRTVATFATGKSEDPCRKAIADVQAFVKMCNANPGPTMVALITEADEVPERVARFADEIARSIAEPR